MIEESKTLMILLAKLANVAGKVLEDGKVGLDDAVHLYEIFKIIPSVQSVNFAGAFEELKSGIDSAEYQKLLSSLVIEFDIPQDEIEHKIEASFAAIGDFLAVIGKLRGAWAK